MKRGIGGAFVSGLLIAVVAAGCGGSNDTSLSKAAFVKQGNAICKEGYVAKNNALEAALRKVAKKNSGESPGSAEEAHLVAAALPPIQTMAEELDALGVPSGEEKTVGAIVEGFETEVEKLEENPSMAVKGTGDPFAEASKLASEYGMTGCAKI